MNAPIAIHRPPTFRRAATRVMRLTVPAAAALLLLPLGPALAARDAAAPLAAPARFAPPGDGVSLLRVVPALLLVLAAVFAASWLMKRLRGIGGAHAAHLEVVAQLPLGARERAVLLRVGTHELLLGVASGSVSLLFELPAATDGDAAGGTATPPGAPATPAIAPGPTFRALLLRSLGR